MVRTSRRRVLAGVTMAALAGCVGDTDGDDDSTTTAPESTPTETATPAPATTPEPDSGDDSLSEHVVAALDPIPAAVDGSDLSRIVTTAPGPDGDGTFNRVPMGGTPSRFGLDPGQVDQMATGAYGDSRAGVIVVVGSFGADEPEIPERVAERGAVDRADGRLIVAAAENAERREQLLTAATDAVDGEVSLSADARTALAGTSDARYRLLTPSLDDGEGGGYLFDGNVEGLNSVSLGARRIDEINIQVDAAGVFEDADAYDRDAFVELIEGAGTAPTGSTTVERDGRLAVASFTTTSPSREVQERQPEIYVQSGHGEPDSPVEIRNGGEEPVDTSALTVLVDGEPVGDVFEGDEFGSGETATLDAQPLSTVAVEWTDPESGHETVVTVDLVTAGLTFENDYDMGSETLTITYTGETTVEATDRLEVEVRSPSEDGSRESETTFSLADRVDVLDAGTEITLEDVALGERVTLSATYDYQRGNSGWSGSASVHHFRARVPGRFTLDREDGLSLVYVGEPQDPANYEVTVAGERPETTLADAHDTLEAGAELPLSADPGDEVGVEWVGTGGPIEQFSEYVQPAVDFELARSGDGFELTYRSEESYDADAFVVRSGSEDLGTVFADEYDTLSDGDTVTIELPEPSHVVVQWTGAEESLTVAHSGLYELLDFELRGSSLTFRGRGEWPAGEFEVTVGGETVSAFSGTITEGDSADLDAEVGETVAVTWTGGERDEQVVSEQVHPSFEFGVSYDESAGQATITSEVDAAVDADRLEVVVQGSEDYEERPDAWADAHDTVEQGDSVTVSVPEGSEAVILVHDEWSEHVAYSLPDGEPLED